MNQIFSTHRRWLLASILIGITYSFHHSTSLGLGWIMVWKALACLFLAGYVWSKNRHFACVMVFCALGDALLMVNLIAGGAVFAVAHVVAIVFYARNRRAVLTNSQRLLGYVLPIANPCLLGPVPIIHCTPPMLWCQG